MTHDTRWAARVLSCLSFAAFFLPLAAPRTATATYDPRHGRWLQRDPLAYRDSMNLYVYVKSRPTRGVDPYGEECGAPYCYYLIDLVEQWAAKLERPCTQKIVRHFLRGGGGDLSCPGECSSLIRPYVKAETQKQVDRSFGFYNACKLGRDVPIGAEVVTGVTNASGDLGSGIGRFKLMVDVKGNQQCVAKLAWGGFSTQCCRRTTAVGVGTVDDWIDYDEGKAGGTPLARLLNDCAAFLEDTGIGRPFWIRGCSASAWAEGERCP